MEGLVDFIGLIIFLMVIYLLFLLGFAVHHITSLKTESSDVFWGIKVVQNKYIALPLEQYIYRYEEEGFITIFQNEQRAKEYCQIMNCEVEE